ncbi:hypothetical protein EJ04DRAFT_513380 [Polyplosphaeria fusca]|uniref:Uncharacterized protein n=1 Tax=Polyplosphaeria fusca TaxID=682080 RepID=A0A9P4QSR8_9PLEO|nr:hypothetical protein EJ04DRAFT_513380 [Polyplosphaeria fusca]
MPVASPMASPSSIESLPPEIVNNVLSYLIHPRSRLPGRTEYQSSYDCPEKESKQAKAAYYLRDHTTPPDVDRFAAKIFSWPDLRHPFNALALTSVSLRKAVESFCAHLVRVHNVFNLPYDVLQPRSGGGGAEAVHPGLNSIVYRRLWLQWAPRQCVFCNIGISCYPHKYKSSSPIVACDKCFYAQVLTLQEVEAQLHLFQGDLKAHTIDASEQKNWYLRVDVEALALKFYGTRKFHDIRTYHGEPTVCSICVRAGTLDRARQYKSTEDAPSDASDDSDGWLVKRPVTQDAIQTAQWPQLLPYRFDRLQYEYKERSSTGEIKYHTYIGHHLSFRLLGA